MKLSNRICSHLDEHLSDSRFGCVLISGPDDATLTAKSRQALLRIRVSQPHLSRGNQRRASSL